MAIPTLADLMKPPGTGRTLRCIIQKNGKRSEITAYCVAFDAATDEVRFPPHLYEGDGFTLIAMEGEPDFRSLSMN